MIPITELPKNIQIVGAIVMIGLFTYDMHSILSLFYGYHLYMLLHRCSHMLTEGFYIFPTDWINQIV